MSSYELVLPAYIEGYEFETEAKGYLPGVRVIVDGRVIEFEVYDEVRLGQEIAGEVEAAGFYSAARLLVVSKVNRAEIARAVSSLSATKFRGFA